MSESTSSGGLAQESTQANLEHDVLLSSDLIARYPQLAKLDECALEERIDIFRKLLSQMRVSLDG